VQLHFVDATADFVQQLGHVGFNHFALFDPGNLDTESNLSRNVLAAIKDFELGTPKVELAERKLKGIAGTSLDVEAHHCRWQERPEALAACDIILGGVDTFKERHELEAFARRYLIPYIDIGLDVTTVDGEPPRMAGQVILSMPGAPCMWCLKFLTEKRLGLEAGKYGDVGGRPQVVWANGVLASTAIGVVINLLCNWTQAERGVIYLSYDGNSGCISNHPLLPYLATGACPHYPLSEIGPPRYTQL
jgi:hypothetical protein